VTELAKSAIAALDWAVLVYFACLNAFYLLLLVSAGRSLARQLGATWQEPRERLLSSRVVPRISVLAPAHNEAATVAESVRALLTLRYPSIEVVLVNDGSSDDTLEVLQREFELTPIHPIVRLQVSSKKIRGLYRSALYPDLVVVDKPNGGKSDALNAGLNVATGTLVCAADADTLIEPDALLKMIRPFLEREDVVAVGATIRVANSSTVKAGRVVHPRIPRRFLAGVQTMEYLRAFLFGRLGWNHLGGNLIISGAFGLFRREGMIAAGGYLHGTVGEDMELVARLRRLGLEAGGPHRVEFVAHPVAWTEVPESLKVLANQRDRWHRGLADVLWRYRGVIGRPRYGALGLVVMPYFLLGELLAPVIEAAGIISLAVAIPIGAVDARFAVMFFLVAYGGGLLLNVFTLMLEERGLRRHERIDDRLRMLPWAVLESIGYRQLTVIWRLRGLFRFLRGRTDWGSMTRRGFATEREPAPAEAGG
jgi:cellulose synthase/poly-beta-1,6-N-acetylglucosamine synthase-like glycosyltransferase